jgi:tRNA(Ile)-lysidine synthase
VDGFFRPLLHLTRDEIRTSLRNRGLDWREDSSNGDQRFARNRLRSQLLPQLARDWNPAIEQALARTAEWAVAEEDYWEAELDRLAAETFVRAEPDLIVRWSEEAPVAVQRRLIRRAIEQAKGDLRQIDFAHVEQIRQLRAGRTSIPGLVVERSFNWLRIGPGRPAPKPFHLAAEIPGEISIGEAGVDFRFELKPAESVYNGDEDQLDWGRVSGALELRNWHPGDQYRRVGHTNDEKLKQLFQRARIPVWERHLWPVLICGNKIAWTRMFGAAAEMARTADTRMILVITENLAFRNRKL